MHFAFGDFELDIGRCEIRRLGKLIPVQPKAFDLLALLARAGDRVVSHEEILLELWPSTSVTQASLYRAIMAARRTVGDDGERQEIIRSVRGRGLRLTLEVRTKAQAIAPPKSNARTHPLFGRARILDQLDEYTRAALDHQGSFVLLRAEAGAGKTRLLSEMAERANRMGAETIALQLGNEPDSLVMRWLRVLKAQPTGAHESPHGLGPMEALLDLLVQRSTTTSYVFTLDDLDSANAEDWMLLRWLAPELPRLPILLLGALCPSGLAREGHAAAQLSRLLREPGVYPVDISGLTAEAIATWVRHRTGRRIDPDWSLALQRATDGNPHLVREIIESLEFEGRWESEIKNQSLPQGALQVARRRLEVLEPESREALRVVATMGIEADAELLSRALGGDPQTAGDALDDAAAAAILIETAPRSGQFRFASPIFRDALYDELSPGQRASAHASCLRALDWPAQRETLLPILAQHALEAAPRIGFSEAASLMREAAESKALELDPEKRIDLLESALNLLLREEKGESRDRMLVEISTSLGWQLRALGHGDRARHRVAAALRTARDREWGTEFARAALAFAGQRIRWAQRDLEVERILEAAIEPLPAGESGLRACLLMRLVATRHDFVPFESLQPLRRDALDAARHFASAREFGEALATQYAYILWALPFRERISVTEECISRAQAEGDLSAEQRGRRARLDCLLEAGDLPAFGMEIERMFALERHLGEPRTRYLLQIASIARDLARGDMASVETSLESMRAIGQRLDMPDHTAFGAFVTVRLRLLQDRYEEVAEPVARGVLTNTSPRDLVTASAHSWIQLVIGNAEPARELLARWLRAPLPDLEIDPQWRTAAAVLSRILARIGTRSQCRAVYTALEPLRGRMLIDGIFGSLGSVEHHLGLLALRLGTFDIAEDHLERAAAHAREVDGFAWWIETLCVQSALHLARGDMDQAEAIRGEALELAEPRGIPLLREAALPRPLG